MSLSDRNVLQGGGCVSIGEHRVRGFQNMEHRCIQNSIVDHWGPGSMVLTDCQGVLQKWDPLGVDTDVSMEPFRNHDERSTEDWD